MAVVIGRFNPPHAGHLHLIKEAEKHCHDVLVMVGSANGSLRTHKNPLTFKERADALGKYLTANIKLVPLRDTDTNDSWVALVRSLVPEDVEVSLVGYHKDDSSYYLDLFPEWQYVEASPYLIDGFVVSSTELRVAEYLQEGSLHAFPHYLASIEECLQGTPSEKKDILKILRSDYFKSESKK